MTIIRVRDHDGRQLAETGIMTQTERVFIQQQTLEDGMRTIAGKVLLRILQAVDYAGKCHRPVMLIGRKQRAGGLMLSLTVPVHPERRETPPDLAGKGSPGPVRNGKTTQQGEQYYRI